MNRFFAQIRCPQNPTIFAYISEISASSVQITKKLLWKSLNSEINASKLEIWQKFRKYGKNKWILQRSNLSKELIYKLYMTPQDNLSMNPEPLLKRKFRLLRKIVKFNATRVLPVEISNGNKLQFWKEKYLGHTMHKNLGSYG